MLQERVNEFNSAIVNIVGELVYTVGFYNSERLREFVEEGKKNWSSTGRYPFEQLTFHTIKSNAVFIVQQDGIEVARYKYVHVKNGTMVYTNEQNKSGKATAVYEIRREEYSQTWNIRFAKESLTFETWEEMKQYFLTNYQYDIGEEFLNAENITP